MASCWHESHFGYKDHTKVNTKSKFIDSYTVTYVEVHDSMELPHLISKEDSGQPLHADSAYSGKSLQKIIKKAGMKNCVNEKGVRSKPLTDKQKQKIIKNQQLENG